MHKHRPSFMQYMVSIGWIVRYVSVKKQIFKCKECASNLKIRKNYYPFFIVIDILFFFMATTYGTIYRSSFQEYRTLLLDYIFLPLGHFLLSIMLNVITYVFVDFEVCDNGDKGDKGTVR